MNKNFEADKQTLEDLNILGKYKPHSVFSICNQVKTAGGERLLEDMFRQPFQDPDMINRRSNVFRFFSTRKMTFPVDARLFAVAEAYLSGKSPSGQPAVLLSVLRKKLAKDLMHGVLYDNMRDGIYAAIKLLQTLEDNIPVLTGMPDPELLKVLHELLANEHWAVIRQWRKEGAELSLFRLASCHHFFCAKAAGAMQQLLTQLYHLDVYIAVGNVAAAHHWSFALAKPAGEHCCYIKELWHPALKEGVANSVSFNRKNNLMFLTGANMAGKSTLMKAMGIAVYMAHIGFPVAAREMEFSIRDGLFTSINVPDNLNSGYSHFYAEVLRVKQVAEQVSKGRHMLVIFDELFKGTNVKDAYDATLAVTESLARYRNCFFVISTHIIEVADGLGAKENHIQFRYMPTVMNGTTPQYTYKLSEGVTSDRQGMLIIEQEGILDMLG